MSEKNLFNDILAKKEKNIISKEDFSERYPHFFNKLGKITNRTETTTSYENENLSISLHFENTSLQEIDSMDSADLSIFFRRGINSKEKIDLNDYSKLTDLILTAVHDKYKLSNEAKQPLILFKKDSAAALMPDYAFPDLNLIIINSPLATAHGILALQHELGHINDEKIAEEDQRLDEIKFEAYAEGGLSGEMNMERDAIRLRRERYAWAQALTKLKPFMPGLGIENHELKAYIHEYNLGSHCGVMSDNYED